jgi:hypothetical protein
MSPAWRAVGWMRRGFERFSAFAGCHGRFHRRSGHPANTTASVRLRRFRWLVPKEQRIAVVGPAQRQPVHPTKTARVVGFLASGPQNSSEWLAPSAMGYAPAGIARGSALFEHSTRLRLELLEHTAYASLRFFRVQFGIEISGVKLPGSTGAGFQEVFYQGIQITSGALVAMVQQPRKAESRHIEHSQLVDARVALNGGATYGTSAEDA